MKTFFRKMAKAIACAIGSPYAFALAVGGVLLWACLGPVFGFSDTWQLVINTSTTIITFLVVFMIQNTQNRDSKALHLKMDELIRAIDAARNGLIDSEDLSDEELSRLEKEFAKLRTDPDSPATKVRTQMRG
ncbi:low affinity iron permease family protein [soil metagenome]